MYECMFGKLKDRPQSRLRQGGLSRAIMIVREDDDRMRDAVQHSCLLTNMQEMCDCAKEYIFQATHTQVSIVFSAQFDSVLLQVVHRGHKSANRGAI